MAPEDERVERIRKVMEALEQKRLQQVMEELEQKAHFTCVGITFTLN